jgi:hypothetical protein
MFPNLSDRQAGFWKVHSICPDDLGDVYPSIDAEGATPCPSERAEL